MTGSDVPWGIRRKPPDRRRGYTVEVVIGGYRLKMYVGMYEGGQPCEVFLDLPLSAGESLHGLTNAVAIQVSFALQYGVPLADIVEKMLFTKFAPAGVVQHHPRISMATSLLDFVGRHLAIDHLGRDDLAHKGGAAPERP